MRKVIWTCAAISVAVMLFIAINPPKSILKEQAQKAARQEKAVQAAREEILEDPTVQYLYYDADLADWTVGVFDDGSSRVGYAKSVCQILKDHGALTPGTEVRMVDVADIRAGKNYHAASLGRANCASGKVYAP